MRIRLTSAEYTVFIYNKMYLESGKCVLDFQYMVFPSVRFFIVFPVHRVHVYASSLLFLEKL